MNRGIDYEWDSTKELPELNLACGFCGKDISSKAGYAGWEKLGGSNLPHRIYICHGCGMPNFFNIGENQTPVFKSTVTFSDAIQVVSPRFVKIYNQSQRAEDEKFDEIAGVGYGKALEFLVKDYLIKNIPAEAEAIKSLKLYRCIHEKVDNPKIKALAEKARSIRNDETHYERKYEDSDIKDLKNIIKAMAAWIELESYTAETISEPIPKEAL